ncbi:Extracellular matrix protein FRAS1 [Holothuria leucospilota]|uniref:Extracellular matrix protein FRAS1 n=1 Tax=Holothuria leucospilota TaxID=206669 RepID=A0A9Q1CI81_HOLLE|nr:Extracellular matrix protein FRAS1 [Holothuria leucospilota]
MFSVKRCKSSRGMVKSLLTIRRTYWILFIILFCQIKHSSCTDVCPLEYRLCSTWYCPRLPQHCPGNRAGADPCGCCTVCLRQVGERCSVPKQPCDAQFGLYCRDGRCRGQHNLQIRSATDSSINLRWDAFLPDSEIRGQYVVYHSTSFFEDISESVHGSEVGNQTVASVRNLDADTEYYFRLSYRIPGPDGLQLEGPLSEVALHRTGTPAPFGGCEHDGMHYDEGMTVIQSCDSACDCLLGTWICRPRGCPPGPDTMLNPINCKEISHPDDPECCSIIDCMEGPNDPDNPGSCQREGQKVHAHGETYYYGCDELCYCDNSQEFCSSRCPDPGTMIPDESTCPKPVLNAPAKGECCPFWSCPPPLTSCEINGNTYEDGEYFDLGCSMRCRCENSAVSCVNRCPPYEIPYFQKCANPRRVHVPGECCWQWECQEVTDSCLVVGENKNVTLQHGQKYEDGCETHCRCNHGELECIPFCVEPSKPQPTPLCPSPMVTKLRPDDCCKVIACHDPNEDSPNVVRNVSIYAFNASSITVAFSPPLNRQIVSQLNGYIIYYTNEAFRNLEVSEWNNLKQQFPPEVTIEGRIMIDIGQLQPNSTYYIQIQVSLPEDSRLQWANTVPHTDTIVVTTTEGLPQHCTFKSQVYQHNESFTDGCAALCQCKSGRTVCRERCPSTHLLPSGLCENPQLVVIKNECCPEWRCFPTDGDCTHKDKTYKNGMEWREACDTRCSCRNGRVNCSNICTAMTTQRPNCAYAVPAQVADTCCKEWVCYDNPHTAPSHPSVPVRASSIKLTIQAVNVSSQNVTIVWPALTDLQRQYIRQFQLKYRNLTYGSDQWLTEVDLRPEIPKFTLLNLRPAKSYVVMLVVLFGDTSGSMIHLQSNKVEVDTLWVPSKPYPGRPFDLFVLEVTKSTVTLRWDPLPFEIAQGISGWRLIVTDQNDNEVIASEIVERTAISYQITNLTENRIYHIQLLGLWDNGTLTHEVHSKTVEISLLQASRPVATVHRKAMRAVLGILFFIVILLIPVVVYMYIKVKRRYHNQYDVYARSTTINYDNSSTYEHVYEESPPQNLTEVTGGSEDNLLDPVRRDSEAGLLER